MHRPRVVVADDHEEVLQAEVALLEPHFDVIGVARDGVALVREVNRLHPDVVVLDITMPKMGGIEAIQKLIQSGSDAKYVFLTIHSGEEFVKACLAEGARAYVWKTRMKAHLVPAVQAVLDGLPYVSPLTPG